MPVDYKILHYYFWKKHLLSYYIRKARTTITLDPFKFKYPTSIKSQPTSCTFTIFDIETTGFFPALGDEVLSIGAIKVREQKVLYEDTFYKVVKPVYKVPKSTLTLVDLKEEDLVKGEYFPLALQDFLEFSKGTILVAHPASFDIHFLKIVAKLWDLPPFTPKFVDSHQLANTLFPSKRNYLDQLIERFKVEKRERHHALNDAIMTAEVFIHLLNPHNKISDEQLIEYMLNK